LEQSSNSVTRERLFASLLLIVGLYTFLLSLRSTQLTKIPLQEYLLGFLFIASIIVADRYPIHLMRGTKVALINLPIFLSTALLPAPLAIFVTGTGLLIADLLARVERGRFPRDIAATVGQWMLIAYSGAQILHAGLFNLSEHVSQLGLLLLCAFAFLWIDLTLFSISQASIYGEPVIGTLKAVINQGFFIEVIQYLIAILGILAAEEAIGSLILLAVPISITYIAFKNIKETRYETVQILRHMANTVDLRDPCTGGHSKQVADLVHQMLIQLQVSGPEAILIETSASLHDIGKIGIPDHILLKPDRLSSQERALMQTHSQKGAELISKYKDFSRGALMIMHHHERWDGQGYPAGLKEYNIPFGARVIAVADSFEAMTSDRPYRKALSVDQAIQILLEGRGKQWDPVIVNTFVDMIINRINETSIECVSKLQIASATSQTILAAP